MSGVIAHLAVGVSPKAGDPPIKFPIADDSRDRVKALAAVEHTPERVAKFNAAMMNAGQVTKGKSQAEAKAAIEELAATKAAADAAHQATVAAVRGKKG